MCIQLTVEAAILKLVICTNHYINVSSHHFMIPNITYYKLTKSDERILEEADRYIRQPLYRLGCEPHRISAMFVVVCADCVIMVTGRDWTREAQAEVALKPKCVAAGI